VRPPVFISLLPGSDLLKSAVAAEDCDAAEWKHLATQKLYPKIGVVIIRSWAVEADPT
jgi:hypothetical protein